MFLRDDQSGRRGLWVAEAPEAENVRAVIGKGAGDTVVFRPHIALEGVPRSAHGDQILLGECLLSAGPRAPTDSGPEGLALRSARLGTSTVGEFLAYVDQRLGRKLLLSAVARRLGLSRAVFTKQFRSSVGQSFHQYVIMRRIELAQRLLLDTSLALKRIAGETGFCSTSHFVVVFRALSDITPGRFREQLGRASDAEIPHEDLTHSCC